MIKFVILFAVFLNCVVNADNDSREGTMRQILMEQMETCLEVDFPRDFKEISMNCFSQVAEEDKSSLLVNIQDGEFPEKSTISSFYKDLMTCRYESLGALEDELDSEKLLQSLRMDEYSGDNEDIATLKRITENCANNMEGDDTTQKLLNFEKCINYDIIDHCKNNDDDAPGMAVSFMTKILSLEDDFGCGSVQIPSEVEDTRTQCIEEATSNLPEIPERITRMRNPMKKMKLMMRQFMKEFSEPMCDCISEKLQLFDQETMTDNAQGLIDFISGLEGWDGNEDKRDAVIDGIRMCGEEAERMSESQEENDDGSMESMESLLDMTNSVKKMNFLACLAPEYTKACGMNNDLADFMFPFFNKMFMSNIGNAFMEYGGTEAETMMDVVRNGMRNPQFYEKLKKYIM